MKKYGKLKKRITHSRDSEHRISGTDNSGKVNRQYKDYLFRLVFGDESRKENILALYNAMNGRTYADPSCITITTLQDAMYVGVRNDVSFVFEYMGESYENLWEHESTYCPNMPLRGLLYFASLYKGFLESQNISIHGCKLIKIPTPKYLVFYNGRDERPAVETMKLSDAFMTGCDKGDYEWSATVYDLNAKENDTLIKNCRPLFEYSEVVKRVEAVMKFKLAEGEGEKALYETIQGCIRDGLLADILSKNCAEVLDMCNQEIEQRKYENSIREEAKESGYNSGYNSGYSKGQSDGYAKGETDTYVRLVKDNILTIGEAAERLGMTPEELEKIF